MKTILLVGLGNPEKKYAKTRHNAGFMFVDYFWKNFRGDFDFSNWEFKKNLNAEISIGKIKKAKNKKLHLNFLATAKKLSKLFSGEKIILLKPQTFMNLSGKSVLTAKKYYKVKFQNIIVAHDDIDLSLGKCKVSTGSSSAGHNGVQSAIDHLGTKNFTRIRIGINNRANKKIPTEKYVLGNFSSEELKMILNISSQISEELIKKCLS